MGGGNMVAYRGYQAVVKVPWVARREIRRNGGSPTSYEGRTESHEQQFFVK